MVQRIYQYGECHFSILSDSSSFSRLVNQIYMVSISKQNFKFKVRNTIEHVSPRRFEFGLSLQNLYVYISFCAVFSMFYAGKLAKMYQLRGTNQLSGFKTSSFYHSLCLYGSAVEYSNIYPTSVWLSNCNTTKMRR